MRRHDPDDAAPCPGAAACEKGLGLIEEGRHGGGQDRVVATFRQVGRLPAGRRSCAAPGQGGRDARAWSRTVRWRSRAARDRLMPHRVGRRRRRHRAAGRPRARRGGPAAPQPQRSPTCRWPRHRARADRCRIVGQEHQEELTRQTRGRRHTSPRTVVTCTARRLRAAKASFYIRTPRPMRSRVTATGGRSPGLRVVALDHLPRHLSAPSGISVASSPLTVAGAAAESNRVPF